jgi:aspartyl-tRNA(Asn)/glutamyl-tRNA(Gln) amidotransferase subunit B
MNRSGVPLVEIVSGHDIRSPAEASEYLRKIRSILRYLRICDGNMEEGSMRCDVNVSLREKGEKTLGTQTEIKNVNSFKFVEQALQFEIERQRAILDSGGEVNHDTLLWDEHKSSAQVMRTKEEAHDYRYFPEPDLLVLKAPRSMVGEIAASLPELPETKERRFVEEHGLSVYDAGVLTSSGRLADYYEAVVVTAGDTKASCNWVMGEVLRYLKELKAEIDDFPIEPSDLGHLIAISQSGRINTPTAKEVFKEMLNTGKKADAIIKEKDLEQISDYDALVKAATKVLNDNPDGVAKYLRGKDKMLRFLVGQMMKETQGKANPKITEEILKALLEKRRHQR